MIDYVEGDEDNPNYEGNPNVRIIQSSALENESENDDDEEINLTEEVEENGQQVVSNEHLEKEVEQDEALPQENG